MKKRAIVLFNLGGPDNLKAVRPFLYNLFKDPAIINLPALLRIPLAMFISIRRTEIAKNIYQKIGGNSPILKLSLRQRRALELALKSYYTEYEVRVFLSMRYWHPMSSSVLEEVMSYNPDELLLLPLYPQYSTTTSGSSLKDWEIKAKKHLFDKPTFSVCCYGTQKKWVDVQATLLTEAINKAAEPQNMRILFSAHGLPKKIIQRGDPYQWQVEESAKLVASRALIPSNDWKVCYQSKVGPLEWIGPSVEEELERASNDHVGVVLLPIAFVSEHSETLVELDIEYRELAKELGVKEYCRVPTVGTHPTFIESLKEIVISSFDKKFRTMSARENGCCPEKFKACPYKGV